MPNFTSVCLSIRNESNNRWTHTHTNCIKTPGVTDLGHSGKRWLDQENTPHRCIINWQSVFGLEHVEQGNFGSIRFFMMQPCWGIFSGSIQLFWPEWVLKARKRLDSHKSSFTFKRPANKNVGFFLKCWRRLVWPT